MLISTALLLDSIIRNSVCTPAKLPCRRVEVGYKKKNPWNPIHIFQIMLLTRLNYLSNSNDLIPNCYTGLPYDERGGQEPHRRLLLREDEYDVLHTPI
jgi:hypothetical protein